MDLIYTNKSGTEQGIIMNYSFDQEDSLVASENCTFEIQISSDNAILEVGSYVYIPNTEIGGRVDTIKVDTSSRILYASGRTWRGLLATKLLYSTSDDYYTLSGNITTVFNQLINTLFGTGSLFKVVTDQNASNINIKVDNYTDLYIAIVKALNSVKYKLKTVFVASLGKTELRFSEIDEFNNENTITSDMFEFVLQTGSARVNHAIGKTETLKVDRYLQANGTVGSTRYYSGIDEIVKMYDFSSETEEDLITETDNALLEEHSDDTLEVTALDLKADLGDLFEAEDMMSKIKMSQNVTKKIVRINHDVMTYQYEVGEINL